MIADPPPKTHFPKLAMPTEKAVAIAREHFEAAARLGVLDTAIGIEATTQVGAILAGRRTDTAYVIALQATRKYACRLSSAQLSPQYFCPRSHGRHIPASTDHASRSQGNLVTQFKSVVTGRVRRSGLDQWGISYDQPLPLLRRQVSAALQGVVRQRVSPIRSLAVDTHGHSHFGSGLAKLQARWLWISDLLARTPWFGSAELQGPSGGYAVGPIVGLCVSMQLPFRRSVNRILRNR